MDESLESGLGVMGLGPHGFRRIGPVLNVMQVLKRWGKCGRLNRYGLRRMHLSYLCLKKKVGTWTRWLNGWPPIM